MIKQEVPFNKFAFVGPSSVGKSTMTEIYRTKFVEDPRIAVLGEGAHLFFKHNPDVTRNDLNRTATQRRIQDFVVQREKDAHKPGIELMLTDRSAVDPMIYTLLREDIGGAEQLYQNVAYFLPTYTEFLLLSPDGVPYEDGPMRETPKDRLKIYQLFLDFFIKYNLPVEVVAGSLQERVAKVNLSLKALGEEL